MWTQKYKPRSLGEIFGNRKLIEIIKGYKWKKPLLIYGASGVGKTVISETIARELNYELIEINERNIENAKNISQTSGIFGKRKLILVDNVDQIENIKLVVQLLKETKNPTLLITSDLSSKRLKTIKTLCEKIQIRRPHTLTIVNILLDICKKEKIEVEKRLLEEIAKNSNGDIRSAINDLETIAKGKKRIKEEDLEILEKRDRETDIYNALNLILMGKDFQKALESTWNLSEEPRNILLWIDENLPRVFRGKDEINLAYHFLSRADIFIGRVMRRQYWGFLRYANPLMTGGVNLAKGNSRVNYTRYQFPMYIIKLSRTKKERDIERSIGEKLSPFLHVSEKIVTKEFIPLFRILLKNEKIDEKELVERFGLNPDELEYLKG